MTANYDTMRRLREALISDLESHGVGPDRLPFSRETGRQWFYDNESEPVGRHLRAGLERCLTALERDGVSRENLAAQVAILRLDCLASMHPGANPADIFSEEFELSSWYRTVKRTMDPDDELTDREFAVINTHLLLQEMCYMLEKPHFLQPQAVRGRPRAGPAFLSQPSVERRMTAGADRSMWQTWKPYTVAVLVAVGVFWWYQSISPFADLEDGPYSCRAVFVNESGKYQLLTDASGREYRGRATVRGHEVVALRGTNRLGAGALDALTIKSRGNSHFHATDEAVSHSYNAMACDHRG